MSLGIRLIDKNSGKQLNENFGVLIDDSLSLIRDKLFVFAGLQYYPNFVKFEIKRGENDFLILLDYSSLDFDLKESPIIYVSTVFNITDKSSYNNLDLNPYNLYNKLKENDNVINELYEILIKDFMNLTLDDLNIIVKMKMIDFINQPGNELIISSSEREFLEKEIRLYFTSIENELKSKKQIILTEQKNLQNFYNEAYGLQNQDLVKYYDLTSKGDRPLFNYTNVVFNIKGLEYEAGISGRFIKLQQIFNTFELSEEIPFMVYNLSKSTPMVKIYNKIIDTVSDNTIKSWILNEKKKLNQISYKKIKGLLFKYKFQYRNNQIDVTNYLTILLNENGLLTVKISFNDQDQMQSIETIETIVKSSVDDLIDKLNKLNAFSRSKQIQLTSMSIINIVSLNAFLIANKSIHLDTFRRMLTQVEIRNIFEAKETVSKERDRRNDILLMYYKKIGKREQDDILAERKGLTVNIKDNPYKLDSSIITIYGGYNLTQLQTIVNQIIVTSLLMDKPDINLQISTIFDDLDIESEEEKSIKEKSNIKLLRQRGVKIFSSKCQKPRQPIIDDNLNVEKNRTMIYENNRYVCPNDNYPYPGFTPDNIPCCFKFPGKGMAQNIKNTKIFETKVQPSNFMVKIEDSNGKTYDTYVIKIISDIEDGFDMNNPYYYISYHPDDAEFPLKHIHNDKLIEKIKTTEENESNMTMWLEIVPLSQLINKPSKSKCQYQPNFDIINKNHTVHAACKDHSKNNYFGYNINSYPCCFDKERPLFNIRKAKEKDSTKQHILITDKLLSEKRQGLLPPGLNKLLNEIIQTDQQGAFLRWGVNQNKLSFFNCILEAIENKIDETIINNTTELKRILITYLQKNPSEFEKLNNGTISLKWSTVDEYINEIENHNIHWKDVIDLITKVLKCNILILDIPYIETESTKTFDYNNTKLICNFSINLDKTKPFIILIKKQQAFEVVIYNTGVIWDGNSIQIKKNKTKPTINFVFNWEPVPIKQNIVTFLLEFYSSTCIKENDFPTNYSYDTLYDINELIQLLEKTSHKIYFQLVNSFNKVNYVVTKRGVILPVKESGIINLSRVSFEEYIEKSVSKSKKLLLDINNYSDLLNDLNIFLTTPIKLLGVTIDSTNKINGAMSNFGQIIPLQPINQNDMKINLQILPIKYYYDIDKFLSNKTTLLNPENEWNISIESLRNQIYEIKQHLAEQLSNDIETKTSILNIIKNPNISRIEKINRIVINLENYIIPMNILFSDNSNLKFILKHIANEMINDNIENKLLNNIVTSEVFNPNEIIKRNNESVWLNLDDIKKWIQKFKTQE